MRNIPAVVIALAFLTLTSCKEGPTGPAGPPGAQGPPGPAGAAGAVNRVDFTGTFNSSGAFDAPLPAESVAGGKVPAIACYISDSGQTWLAVAYVPSSSGSPFCGLEGVGTSDPRLVIVNGFTGWRYYLIVMW